MGGLICLMASVLAGNISSINHIPKEHNFSAGKFLLRVTPAASSFFNMACRRLSYSSLFFTSHKDVVNLAYHTW